MVITAPASPHTKADRDRLVYDGLRDIAGAAFFLGRSESAVRRLVTSGALWSYTAVEEGRSRGKRLIPLVELRRYASAEMEDAVRGMLGRIDEPEELTNGR